MDSLIVYPENEEQLSALKSVINSMKIAFEQKSEEYPAHVIEGIKRSLRDAEEGKVYPFTSIRDMIRPK
ncbi:DUF2683 family protein [Mucilaginibacter ginkgonis]|uniref:DUF2683 family protein n=1 Tax=Mucilaginibacter ginkgonis TaxID=2682091 RepID=UPI0037448648